MRLLSPFTCDLAKVAHPLSPFLLSILSISLLHTKWRHVPASLPYRQFQKTLTYTTSILWDRVELNQAQTPSELSPGYPGRTGGVKKPRTIEEIQVL